MKLTRIFSAFALGAVMVLSACGSTAPVSRDAAFAVGPVIDVPTQNWGLAQLVIDVPRSLSVSESNSIKPRADIVWREDPMGDRHAQVEALMRAAIEPAMAPMRGDIPVQIIMQVTRFHALTERARYTTGGEHEIEFDLVVVHAQTGEILSGPRHVDLTFRAYGGQTAIEHEAQGIFQRDRINARLIQWVHTEFPQTALAGPSS